MKPARTKRSPIEKKSIQAFARPLFWYGCRLPYVLFLRMMRKVGPYFLVFSRSILEKGSRATASNLHSQNNQSVKPKRLENRLHSSYSKGWVDQRSKIEIQVAKENVKSEEGVSILQFAESASYRLRADVVESLVRFAFAQLQSAGGSSGEIALSNDIPIQLIRCVEQKNKWVIQLTSIGRDFRFSPSLSKLTLQCLSAYFSENREENSAISSEGIGEERTWGKILLDSGFLLQRERASFIGRRWAEEILKCIEGDFRNSAENKERDKVLQSIFDNAPKEIQDQAISLLQVFRAFGEMFRVLRYTASVKGVVKECCPLSGDLDRETEPRPTVKGVEKRERSSGENVDGKVIWMDFKREVRPESSYSRKVYGSGQLGLTKVASEKRIVRTLETGSEKFLRNSKRGR